MKIGIETSFCDRGKEMLVLPRTCYSSEAVLRGSKSCKVSIRLPTVENEKKSEIQKQVFPLRTNSAGRIVKKKPLSITPNLLQMQINEKVHENKVVSKRSGLRSVKCAYDKLSCEPIEFILNSHLPTLAPLPDPHILEHRRAALRLRKLKMVPVKHGKENCSFG